MHDKSSEDLARHAAGYLHRKCGFTRVSFLNPTIGVVLGTGWGNSLRWRGNTFNTRFENIPGFLSLRPLEGHNRTVICGQIEGQNVIALQGRVHLNEAPADPQVARNVRLQVEMLLQLGVRKLILTAAAGSLKPKIEVGDIMIVDGFVSLFAPDMPLFAGEFCSPDDTLAPRLREIARRVVNDITGKAHEGGYAMVRGPFFEGRKYDKAILRASGASTVGMSSLPEACIAALYPGVEVLALNFVTNTDSEAHSHEENQRRAAEKSASMGAVLHGIIKAIGER
jgi:purine-nucleoside phosphorylase